MPSLCCSTCGCASFGQCGAVIQLLSEEANATLRESQAIEQGERATIEHLRMRCEEAEERVRRAEFEVADLRQQAAKSHEQNVGARQPLKETSSGVLPPPSLPEKQKTQDVQMPALAAIIEAALRESDLAAQEASARAGAQMEGGTEQTTSAASHREAFRELCESHEDMQSGLKLKTWTLGAFLTSLGVGDVVADVLLRRLREEPALRHAAHVEHAFARMLSSHAPDGKALVVSLLSEGSLAEEIADRVWSVGSARLNAESNYAQANPTGRYTPLVDKFVADGGASGAGSASDGAARLHGGVGGVLYDAAAAAAEAAAAASYRTGADDAFGGFAAGATKAQLGVRSDEPMEDVRREHCECDDARLHFTSTDYGVTTTSELEYWFVVAPEKGLGHLGLRGGGWPQETSTAACGADPRAPTPRRKPRPLRELEPRWREVNARLDALKCPPVEREELIAARLFTGPLRRKYNAALRALACGSSLARAEKEQLCGANGYEATLLLLNAAILKLSRAATPAVLYRGVSGGVLPRAFWLPDAQTGVRGVVEAGVLSCVRDPTAVLAHATRAKDGLQATALAIHEGIGSCAADLSWLSMYPDEGEHALPPLTSLTVLESRVEGGCLLLALQPSLPALDEDIEVPHEPAPLSRESAPGPAPQPLPSQPPTSQPPGPPPPPPAPPAANHDGGPAQRPARGD